MHRSLRPLAAAIVLAAVAATGCFGSKHDTSNLLIPEEDTAKAQYDIAADQERDARGIFDTEKRNVELEKAAAAYAVVERRFPDDDRFSPASAVMIAEIRRELEQHDRAVAKYEEALKKYPDNETVRIASLLGMGKSLDALKRPEEAQQYYKMLIDQYQGSTNPETRAIVEEARQLFRRIRPRA